MEELLPNTHSSKTNRALPILDKVIQFSLFTFVAFSMFSISVTQISFSIGAIASLLKTHLTKSWKELRATYIGIAILCFCLACVFSVITSVDFGSSLKLLKKLLQFIIFFWVANAVQDEKQKDLLFKLVIVAGAAAALNGLLPLIKPSFFSKDSLYGGTRVIGTMSVPATFSGVLSIAGLAALGRLLFHKPKEYWVMGSVGIISLCLLLSMTRQAWLGFFIGTVLLMFFWNKKYLLVIPLLLASLLLFAPDSIKYRINSFTNLKDGSFQSRVSLWKGGWEIVKDHPITGCGYKCVDSIYSQYPDPSGWIAYHRGMHSNLFQLLVDTGVLGLVTWLSIWVAYFIEIFKRLRNLATEASQNNTAGILTGASAALLAFLVGGFFESSIYDSEVTMLLYFLMGLSLAQVKKVSTVE
jgi:putative inorganic carbon (hco3(-)) transporter